jgi:hypothetical protein
MTTLDQLNADLFKRITDGYDKEISDLRLARDEARKLAEELRDELHAHSVTEAAYDLDTAEPRKPTLPWEEK